MTPAQVIERLREVMRRSARIHVDWTRVHADTPIDTIGFDSLSILDLIYDIQQDFKIEFDAEEMTSVRTVGELADFLIRKGA